MVERALRDRPGLTPREVLDCAATEAERLVKLASIRNELQTGRRQGRYESGDGRWSLVVSPPAVEDGAPDAPASPAASVAADTPDEASLPETAPSREPGEAASTPPGDAVDENAASGEPETGGSQ